MSEKQRPPARVVEVNRAQMRLVPMDLESLLPADHQGRAVWSFVDRLDLGEFYARIQSLSRPLSRSVASLRKSDNE